ncbi:MAG: TldD/PmbA family protein [candidate division WOR-3 bacterium]|nr:TldD/PmbA family protein [candidate division WOR-3 bacterium]
MAELVDRLEELVRCALAKGADQAEAFGQGFEDREVWLENNRIKTAKSHPGEGIGLRVIRNKRLGFASDNSLDEANFDELCAKALALASANLTDKFQIIPEPRKLSALKGLYDPRLAELPLKEAIAMAKRLLKAANDYDRRVTVDSGGVFVNTGEKAIFNSNGLAASEQGSSITAMIMGMARDRNEVSAFDFQFDGSLRLTGIEIEPLARRFAQNVIRSLGAKPARSFTGTVLFSPHAVAETLLGPILSSINANNVQKGMSKLAGKLDKKIASMGLTITDDGLLAGGLSSSAFDREGQPHRKLSIIKDGKLASYLYNSYTANREGRATTGHASGGYRSLPGIGTTNLVISPGEATKAELIREIKEGILVTRFSGNTNPVSGDFSGTVKGGFYIKNGKLANPVTNTMIAGNVFDAITTISGISKKLTKVYSYLLPYMAIERVSVTSG